MIKIISFFDKGHETIASVIDFLKWVLWNLFSFFFKSSPLIELAWFGIEIAVKEEIFYKNYLFDLVDTKLRVDNAKKYLHLEYARVSKDTNTYTDTNKNTNANIVSRSVHKSRC